MKKLLFIFLLLISFVSFSQEIEPEKIDFSFLDPIINFIITTFGSKIVKNMAALYFMGVIFKPLFSFLSIAAKATTWTVKDDEFIVKILESNVYKGIAYILDVVARIKLPKAK